MSSTFALPSQKHNLDNKLVVLSGGLKAGFNCTLSERNKGHPFQRQLQAVFLWLQCTLTQAERDRKEIATRRWEYGEREDEWGRERRDLGYRERQNGFRERKNRCRER